MHCLARLKSFYVFCMLLGGDSGAEFLVREAVRTILDSGRYGSLIGCRKLSEVPSRPVMGRQARRAVKNCRSLEMATTDSSPKQLKHEQKKNDEIPKILSKATVFKSTINSLVITFLYVVYEVLVVIGMKKPQKN
ncbi:hypothetical protein EDC01DRAFT_109121 [Geopyxis carbonaria]|nr:hypothetical protein EDC01DRAFT_109121 [Geopyxis carbonaria]